MAVLDPLKVSVTLSCDTPIELDVPNFPADSSKGTHKVMFSNIFYIEQSDFKEVIFFFYISHKKVVYCSNYKIF